MKSNIYTIITIFAAFFMLQSCENTPYLDTKPLDALSEEAIFSDPDLAKANLLTNYEGIPWVFGRPVAIPWDAETGDVNSNYDWGLDIRMREGDYDASSCDWGPWGRDYDYIRRANVFIEGVEGSAFDDATKTAFIAEARALRAVNYSSLYRCYGKAVIMTKPIPITSKIDQTLSSSDDVFNFIVSELTAVAPDLPVKWDDNNRGRFEKGAALGIKARILLHQATLKNDLTLYGDAADAAKEVIDLNRYELYPDYGQMFLAMADNEEFMLYYQYATNPGRHRFDGAPWLVMNTAVSMGGWGGSRPTLNLVDQFEMTDGKLYSESPLYDDQDPYSNRDPRFYASIYYQGSTSRGRPFENWPADEANGIPEGKDYRSWSGLTTGFFIKKGIDESIEDLNGSDAVGGPMKQYDPFLRYADILLIYAEAKNEVSGPVADVYDAINQVRERAGMPDLPAGLDKDQMRDKIRHERRVELCFEESHFYDMRRYGLTYALSVANVPMWRQTVIKNPDGSLTYGREIFMDHHFNERNLLWPVPQSEIDKNPGLGQNTGY